MATSVTPEAETPPLELGSYQDFKFASPRIKKLTEDWAAIDSETKRLRLLRYIRVDKASLMKDGKFNEGQTYLAIRLTDTNIRQEQPQHVAYLTQSRRSLVFEPKDGVEIDGVAKLEKNFTDKARYVGWQAPYLQVIDGSSHHGWDSIEVVLDVDKPGHFVHEHVGHENLIFDLEAEDINNQELVLRRVKYTSIQLRQNVKKFGFSKEQVSKILASKDGESESQTKDIIYDIYKCYYRDEDNVIYIGWWHDKCDDWVKEPEMFYLGMNDLAQQPQFDPLNPTVVINDRPNLPEVEYPFYLLLYYESENGKITEVRGRGFLDEPAQEAASAVMSGAVNNMVASSQVYGSPENNPGDTKATDVVQLKTVLKPGLYNKKINFWNMPPPPSHVPQLLQAIVGQNKAETAKVDFAALNRKDSRKTAEEVKTASQEASQLSSVQVVNLSTFIQLVSTREFRIYQNRVLQGKIKVNDESLIQLLQQEYNIKSAGDVDVIQRQEKLERMMQAWPVMQKTPAADAFLKNFIRTAFPEDSDTYIKAIDAAEAQGVNLVIGLGAIVQALAVGPDGKLVPEAAPYGAQLQKLAQEAQAYIMANNPAMKNGTGQPASNGGTTATARGGNGLPTQPTAVDF